MRFTLVIPSDWELNTNVADVHSALVKKMPHASVQAFIDSPLDYSALSAFDHETGVLVSALPLFKSMATNLDTWMPRVLKLLERCDIDPAVHARILNINDGDWQAWQQGALKTVTTDTSVAGRLLQEIFYFIYCFVGSLDNVSRWLNQVTCLTHFESRCPMEIIKSGDVKAIAQLQRFLACEVLAPPYL